MDIPTSVFFEPLQWDRTQDKPLQQQQQRSSTTPNKRRGSMGGKQASSRELSASPTRPRLASTRTKSKSPTRPRDRTKSPTRSRRRNSGDSANSYNMQQQQQVRNEHTKKVDPHTTSMARHRPAERRTSNENRQVVRRPSNDWNESARSRDSRGGLQRSSMPRQQSFRLPTQRDPHQELQQQLQQRLGDSMSGVSYSPAVPVVASSRGGQRTATRTTSGDDTSRQGGSPNDSIGAGSISYNPAVASRGHRRRTSLGGTDDSSRPGSLNNSMTGMNFNNNNNNAPTNVLDAAEQQALLHERLQKAKGAYELHNGVKTDNSKKGTTEKKRGGLRSLLTRRNSTTNIMKTEDNHLTHATDAFDRYKGGQLPPAPIVQQQNKPMEPAIDFHPSGRHRAQQRRQSLPNGSSSYSRNNDDSVQQHPTLQQQQLQHHQQQQQQQQQRQKQQHELQLQRHKQQQELQKQRQRQEQEEMEIQRQKQQQEMYRQKQQQELYRQKQQQEEYQRQQQAGKREETAKSNISSLSRSQEYTKAREMEMEKAAELEKALKKHEEDILRYLLAPI